ncbi:2-octaprenyl-3-methyl-6-methoxy-1,4-benzoquinol hydroxylase [Vibrio ishigakensis]|uniref:2-octaprenyl-3-methyl-6-methoxy-1,4-benzoquinol hydroxylase n=1 Tax=Vibrio ishigakensis TaxID=1481914 RepID=A0A0B8QUU6_9VIBR|nr:2-octaprenyl-3-methyl-6-methoxy-1,4-benzoquinol hydroxylase [Vibrio ishigakensis]
MWDAIESMRVHPYSVLETWEWEGFNTRFDAADLKLDNMGFMVENRVIQFGLWQSLESHANVTLFCRIGSIPLLISGVVLSYFSNQVSI